MSVFNMYRQPFPGSDAPRGVDRVRSKVDILEQRLDHAMITMEAMWTLLRERLQISDEDLAKRIVELDESDGILDGKVRRPPKSCPHCRKTIPLRLPRCLYCGGFVSEPFA